MKTSLESMEQQPFVHSKNNIVIEINEEFSHFTGYSKRELIGKSLIDLNKMVRITSRFNLTTVDHECSCFIFTKEGEPREITILCKTHKCENDKIFIFKEKPNSRIEDRLQYAYSLLLHNEIGVAIYSIQDGIFLKTNKEFLDFWSYEATEMENSGDTQDIFNGYQGNGYEDIIIDVVKTKKPFYVKEAKFRDLNRNITYWDISIVPVGEEKYIVHTAVDVTLNVLNREIVNKQEELDAIKIQDEIFANIAHELRTPLNIIFTANQLMEYYLKENLLEGNMEEIFSNNKIIMQNCYRQIKLINNIVDLTNMQSGYIKFHPRYDNIVETIETVVQSVSQFIKGKGFTIIFDTDIEEKLMEYDQEKIERIILNLISNAIKFSNSRGEIFVNIIDKNEAVEISVKDMGIGIEKEQINLIFEKFYQIDKTLNRKAEGNGIGLFLVKLLVEIHEGNISVESEIDKGSIFKIELPARKVKEVKDNHHNVHTINKTEMINIEFSDIYSL